MDYSAFSSTLTRETPEERAVSAANINNTNTGTQGFSSSDVTAGHFSNTGVVEDRSFVDAFTGTSSANTGFASDQSSNNNNNSPMINPINAGFVEGPTARATDFVTSFNNNDINSKSVDFGFKNSGNSADLVPPVRSDSHYVQVKGIDRVLSRLGIKADPNASCVYKPAATKAPVLEVPEIRDKHGKLAQKVESVEREFGLSVIPFEMSGLNNKVVEILNYSIYTLDGKRYISSNVHTLHTEDYLLSAAKSLLDRYCEGGELCVPLRGTFYFDRNTRRPVDATSPNAIAIESIMFNNFEIDYILGALQNIGATVISTEDNLYLTTGALL